MREDTPNATTQEVDILEKSVLYIVNTLKHNFKLIILLASIGGLAGIALSFFFTKQYSSSVEILPEFSNESGGGSFSSLASLAGIDLSAGSKSDAFRPDLYPMVLTSYTAAIYLSRLPVVTKEKQKYPSLIDYLDTFEKEKTKKGELHSTLVNPSIWRFTSSEKQLLENVRSRIKANFDKKSGIVILSVEMPDPEIAANSAVILTAYLKNFLTDYRVRKKKDQSKFLAARVKEANSNLDKAEYALQNYRDRNRNVFANVARIQEQKLQFEFIQRQNVYNELLKEYEKSKIEELQGEDVLITVESPIVPLNASSPRKLYYALGGVFVSMFFLLIYLLKPWRLLL